MEALEHFSVVIPEPDGTEATLTMSSDSVCFLPFFSPDLLRTYILEGKAKILHR
jgi:hypothetical protein